MQKITISALFIIIMIAAQARADTTVTTHIEFQIPQFLNVNWFPKHCGHKETRENNRDCRKEHVNDQEDAVESNGDWSLLAGIDENHAVAVAESTDDYLPGGDEIIARIYQTESNDPVNRAQHKAPSTMTLTFIAE